ncbi:hypothetical protein ACLQ3K_08395 [Tsukamurella sp. DT100]|uniref:hypothetical protein n=1 Tax=Tsukamurella sp. DT100 TaxID=3393415 RepID=UPI003CE951B3
MLLKRRQVLVGLAALPAAAVATSLTVPHAAAADADKALLDAAVAAAPTAREVITVAAPSFSSTDVQVSAWALLAQGWTKVYGPVSGKVGQQGIGEARTACPAPRSASSSSTSRSAARTTRAPPCPTRR